MNSETQSRKLFPWYPIMCWCVNQRLLLFYFSFISDRCGRIQHKQRWATSSIVILSTAHLCVSGICMHQHWQSDTVEAIREQSHNPADSIDATHHTLPQCNPSHTLTVKEFSDWNSIWCRDVYDTPVLWRCFHARLACFWYRNSRLLYRLGFHALLLNIYIPRLCAWVDGHLCGYVSGTRTSLDCWGVKLWSPEESIITEPLWEKRACWVIATESAAPRSASPSYTHRLYSWLSWKRCRRVTGNDVTPGIERRLQQLAENSRNLFNKRTKQKIGCIWS